MKTFQTIDRRPYVATVTTAATVTDKASGLVLAKASEAGQITFLAIGEETIISDDAAVVAPSPFSGASAGSSAGRGVGEQRIEELIDSALSTEEIESLSTPTGTDNALFYWAELVETHVPAGELHEIAIQCRSTAASAMTTEPRYLGLWEATEAGGWMRVGTSLNAVVQAVGAEAVWSFEGVTLAGRALRLCLLPDRDSDWQPDNQVFGARVSVATDGSNITFTSGQSAYIPEMRIAVTTHESRFALAEHVEDAVVHVTQEERESWNAKADASALAAKVNSSTFTSHANDAVKHVTAAERTAWDAATALPSSSNAFAGDNTHAGVETFNGGVLLNDQVLLGGYDLRRVLADTIVLSSMSTLRADFSTIQYNSYRLLRGNCSTSPDIDVSGKCYKLPVGRITLDTPESLAYKALEIDISNNLRKTTSWQGVVCDLPVGVFLALGFAAGQTPPSWEAAVLSVAAGSLDPATLAPGQLILTSTADRSLLAYTQEGTRVVVPVLEGNGARCAVICEGNDVHVFALKADCRGVFYKKTGLQASALIDGGWGVARVSGAMARVVAADTSAYAAGNLAIAPLGQEISPLVIYNLLP